MKDKSKPACQVLVVDDSRAARQQMRSLLESPRCRVNTAASAEEAYAYLDATRPDIIFLDQLLPGTDGLSVLRALRASEESAAIPVVICAIDDSPALRVQAREAGAAEVLPKPPPGVETLKSLIARLVDPARLAPPVREGGLLGGLRGAVLGKAGNSGRVAPAAGLQMPAEPAALLPPRPSATQAPSPPPAAPATDALRALARRVDALQIELAGFRQEVDERLHEIAESVEDLRREQAAKGMALGRAEARVDRLLQELRSSLTRIADGED